MKNRLIFLLFISICFTFPVFLSASPINGLLERIDKGASKKFKIEIITSNDEMDFFELEQAENKVSVKANNFVSAATGINWYLKYYANIHLSWNNMHVKLPKVLPPVTGKVRKETKQLLRYYLNYCTFSYSMAFWDWERWEQEIDWMALHGINLPLAITGVETVWYNVLQKLGYNKKEINTFIAGSGFLAWWSMNNIEGWGGPNPDNWYKQQAELQKKILNRMREFQMEPVLAGYAGMIPSNAKEKLGFEVSNPGEWGGFQRPAFLQPTDSEFTRIADLYYTELESLCGKAKYYSVDPFHEGGSVEGVNLDLAGKAILDAMKKVNKDAIWVAQAWQANPREEMTNHILNGDLLILDLWSEARPMWGPEWSIWYRKEGYKHHNWVYCMLLNFGGRTGLHGKMKYTIDGFYDALNHKSGTTLKGVGATMEAIENNPVLFELIYELPWRDIRFSEEDWLADIISARYGKANNSALLAWNILSRTVYGYPKESVQEGTTETVFAANPKLDITQVSCCSTTKPFYNTDSVKIAAGYMLDAAETLRENNNFEYDLVDIVRQTVANKAYYVQKDISKAFKAKNRELYENKKKEFLELLHAQNYLLETRSEFMLDTWLSSARALGKTTEEKDLYEFNARVQLTLWGTQKSAEGGLNDYAYKEWAGLLDTYYNERWQAFFQYLENNWRKDDIANFDSYKISHQWVNKKSRSFKKPNGAAVDRAKEVFYKYVTDK
ncbi:MAG: alpha-N-acetylglucosaminidase [Dysgonomonas sp.]|nr:alpha-N-acetylglucosaminidase [Dysgonomonas sp.]